MRPLISVIVPVYNGEEYLANCIESIENQTYRPLEVVIVNDGSVDDTEEVCKQLAETYDNVRWITLPDLGVSAARNAGMDEAKGDYITFVDADDRIRPQMLQVLYEALIHSDSEVCGCGFASWKTQREWELLEKSFPAQIEEAVVYTKKEFLKQQILEGNSRCWSKLYDTRFLEENDLQFQEGLTIGEDMLFLVQMLPYVKKIAEVDFQGYGYYQNPQGAMNRRFNDSYMNQIKCWKMARDEAVKTDETCYIKITSILLISIMLTVGKLAELSAREREQYENYVKECHSELLMERKNVKAMLLLSRGYRAKIWLFAIAPHIYLNLYHMHRKNGKAGKE